MWHKADSISEKLVDDWFYLQRIKHERSKRYPEGQYTCDFYLPDTDQWVEYLGLSGESKTYDATTLIKKDMAQRHGLCLVEVFPSMLYPTNTLHTVFNVVPAKAVWDFEGRVSELQALVGAAPLFKIAQALGISRAALSTQVVKHNVILPPVGYWLRGTKNNTERPKVR